MIEAGSSPNPNLEIKYPTLHEICPDFFRAICLAEVRVDGIDIADGELKVSEEQCRLEWKRFAAGEYEPMTIHELAEKLIDFPERLPVPVATGNHDKLSLYEYSRKVMLESVHLANHDGGSQIGLSRPIMEPGGRFGVRKPGRGRVFKWDNLYSAEGAVTLGKWGDERLLDALINFEELVNKLDGNIPNANTTWAKYRSQPNVTARMVRLRAKREQNDEVILEHLNMLEKHYLYLREGADDPAKLGTKPGSHYRRVVRMPNGTIGYRSFDDGPSMGREFRDEMWGWDKKVREQKETALGRKLTPEECQKFAEDMGAGAEGGEDFTGAECADHKNLYTIRSTELVSVKMTALQYDTAVMLAHAYFLKANKATDPEERDAALAKAMFYEQDALDLAECINTFCITDDGFCANYDFVNGKTEPGLSISGVFALSSGIIPQRQGEKMLEVLDERFLKPGGFINTLYDTEMQWDKNAWPLMAKEAVNAAIVYGRYDLALKWALHIVNIFELTYEKYGVLYEKNNPYEPGEPGGNGEYPCVEDLLMTHGVYLALRALIPALMEKATASSHGTVRVGNLAMQGAGV